MFQIAVVGRSSAILVKPTILISDIRVLWRSGLSGPERQSARMSEIKNGGLDHYGKV